MTAEPARLPVEILRYRDLTVSPWHNRGGVTREIARDIDGAADVRWRVSIADIAESGAFSHFPGMDRIAVLVDDNRAELTVDDRTTTLRPHVPFVFSGDSTTSIAVDGGPVHLLNVMVRRGGARAAVTTAEGHQGVQLAGVEMPTRLAVLVQGQGVVLADGAVPLGVLDAVRLTTGQAVDLAGEDVVVAVVALD